MIMKRIAFIVVIIFAVISSCVKIKSKEKRIKVFDYPNLLDLKGIPQQAKDYNSFCFSDKGSWFGFGLAENVDTSFIGFSGPFLMNTNNGKWLSKQFVKLEVLDIKTQEEYVFNKNEITNTYYPGLLEQNSQNQKFNIKQYLWFASSNIAINKIKIINKSEYNKEINLNYSISYFDTL
ncbi:MAG: hypothetical protein U9R54_04420, partial [Bacteroidota bacterium]|nr:hypothetical protein [Bacteroidota bacterium]